MAVGCAATGVGAHGTYGFCRITTRGRVGWLVGVQARIREQIDGGCVARCLLIIQYKIGFYTIWSRFITSTNLNPRLRLSMFKSSSNSSASYLNRSIGGDPRI